MGRTELNELRRLDGDSAAQADDLRKKRFGEHYPGLFAYAYSLTRDEESASQAVISCFATMFSLPGDPDEDEFHILLFALARETCRGIVRAAAPFDGLKEREREVISLMFDGRLDREGAAQVLGTDAQTVTRSLRSGLRKLQGWTAWRAAEAMQAS